MREIVPSRRIVVEARELFRRYDYEWGSMRDLADRVGLRQQSLLHPLSVERIAGARCDGRDSGRRQEIGHESRMSYRATKGISAWTPFNSGEICRLSGRAQTGKNFHYEASAAYLFDF